MQRNLLKVTDLLRGKWKQESRYSGIASDITQPDHLWDVFFLVHIMKLDSVLLPGPALFRAAVHLSRTLQKSQSDTESLCIFWAAPSPRHAPSPPHPQPPPPGAPSMRERRALPHPQSSPSTETYQIIKEVRNKGRRKKGKRKGFKLKPTDFITTFNTAFSYPSHASPSSVDPHIECTFMERLRELILKGK